MPTRKFIFHLASIRILRSKLFVGETRDTVQSIVTPYSSPFPGITRSVRGCLFIGGEGARTHRRYVHQPDVVDRRKQTVSYWPGHSELGRSTVSHELRSAVNIVQFSVMGPGVECSHVAARCPPITYPRSELPCDFAALRLARFNDY